MVFFAVISCIRIISLHSIIGGAIDQVASEFSSTAYILEITSEAQEDGLLPDFNGFIDNLTNFGYEENSFTQYLNLRKHPENAVFAIIVKQRAKEYLSTNYSDVDDAFKNHGVIDGFRGLNFSNSQYLSNDTDVVVSVKYEISMPFISSIIGTKSVEQKVIRAAWLSGDEVKEESNIWSFSNLKRGMEIHKLFKANLPFEFPGISSFINGRAILIRSMNLTAATYSNSYNVRKTIQRYIDDVKEYNGSEIPWGKDNIVIIKRDIKERHLLLIIPRNERTEDTSDAISECQDYAASRSVVLRIVEYGTA